MCAHATNDEAENVIEVIDNCGRGWLNADAMVLGRLWVSWRCFLFRPRALYADWR